MLSLLFWNCSRPLVCELFGGKRLIWKIPPRIEIAAKWMKSVEVQLLSQFIGSRETNFASISTAAPVNSVKAEPFQLEPEVARIAQLT